MLFHSHVFLFAFLPVTLLGFFLLGACDRVRLAGLWLTLASLFFYGWWNPRYLVLIGGSVLFNYQCGVWIAQASGAGRTRHARGLLAAGVTANLALLGYFKYARFLVSTAAALAGTHWRMEGIALPLAISFFTFTQIAYLTDAFHGRTRTQGLLHYGLFVTFFPHLIAGPIVLYRSLMPQFARPETYRFQAENFASGLTLFICGLAKKVIIADTIAPVANAMFGEANYGAVPNPATAWIGAIAYSLQLYFDFSGYSDMAIGLAGMFNLRFPLNFDSPYKARDLIDFWRRWHITLSTFLRDHVYIPLGGNRKSSARRYFNLLLTMLLGGLWHGAGWTFVLWGGWHGAGLCLNQGWLRLTSGRPWARSGPVRFAGWAVTLLAVVAGWVIFRSYSLDMAWRFFQGMVGYHSEPGRVSITAEQVVMLLLAASLALFAPNSHELFRLALPPKDGAEPPARIWRWTPRGALAASAVFIFSLLHLSRISEFLYFQF